MSILNTKTSIVPLVTFFIRWVRQVQKAEGVKPGENVFLLLRLDGRLRKSGKVINDKSKVM